MRWVLCVSYRLSQIVLYRPRSSLLAWLPGFYLIFFDPLDTSRILPVPSAEFSLPPPPLKVTLICVKKMFGDFWNYALDLESIWKPIEEKQREWSFN